MHSLLKNSRLLANKINSWNAPNDSYRKYFLLNVKLNELILKFTYIKKEKFTVVNFSIVSNSIKETLMITISLYIAKDFKNRFHKIEDIHASLNGYLKLFTDTLSNCRVGIIIFKSEKPMLYSLYVSQMVAQNLDRRISTKILTSIAERSVSLGSLGCIIQIKGRINGSFIKRKNQVIVGNIRRNCIKNDIDFCNYPHLSKSGLIGIKVWVNRGVIDKNNFYIENEQ